MPLTDHNNDFEKLFDMSLDILCIATSDGYFKKINHSFSQILGYDYQDVLSTPFINYIHPDDLEPTFKIIKKLGNGENTIGFENRYRHIVGSYRILSWSATADKETGLLYCVGRDVTNHRHTESKLTQLEKALYKETIIALTDQNGIIVEVNDKFCNISGYTQQELIGRTHKIVNSGEHPQSFFESMWRTISSGNTWQNMIINRKKNTDYYYVQTIITPIFDNQGRISNYLAIRFDITERIKTKEHLKKTLKILNETSSIAKVGGWELDISTGELTWTDETFRILEVEKKDSSKPILPEGLNLFTEESKPIIEKAVNDAIEFGTPYDLELQAKTAKGNVVWVYTNGKANYENNKIVTISGTIQDIHAKKLAEQKYEKERIKTIQNAKLASLGELAAGIAHEINNPLSIIYGSNQLIAKFLDKPDKIKTKIQSIDKSCERITKIVKSLKKFSRENTSKHMYNHSLVEIVKESIILTKAKASINHTKIEFEYQSNAIISCDDIEIEQVVVNLINNSLDAIENMNKKWIRLSISNDENNIYLKIIDSGKGISNEVKEKLFDPFFTTKDIGQGTGLGLSITKGILDEHNATISLDDNNENTCFIITFPKVEEK